jgi:acyl carrier protein
MKDLDKIKLQVFNEISKQVNDKSLKITDDTPIIHSEYIDSMKLVEICIALEDKAIQLGFEFDWTSGYAMSRSQSMFKSAGSIADEFVHQFKSKK